MASFTRYHAYPTSMLPPLTRQFSTTTTGSKVNLTESHTLISRKDLRASIACFEELMAAAKAYRNALLAMSSATAAFASAMEACSRVKGCREANSGLAGGAGLQYLISNHEQLLADTVYRQFEIPLLEALDNYKLMTSDRLIAYEKSLHAQSDKIRKTEAENMKIGRRRKRDLAQFRSALAELQRQVDELDAIKLAYHEEVLEAEEETWDAVLSKVAFVIRSQLDFYDKIAGKASDPVLEPLVMSIPDPFDSYGPPKEEGKIFSVLAPLGLDHSPTSPTPNIPRISQSTSNSTSRTASPNKLGALSSIVPARAETSTATSTIAVVGERDQDNDDASGRARRELSVIDEREGSPTRTLRTVDDRASSVPFPDEPESSGADTPISNRKGVSDNADFATPTAKSSVKPSSDSAKADEHDDDEHDEPGPDHDHPTVNDSVSAASTSPPETTILDTPRIEVTV